MEITEAEMIATISKLKTGKGTELYELRVEMLDMAGHVGINYHAWTRILLNKCLADGTSQWNGRQG